MHSFRDGSVRVNGLGCSDDDSLNTNEGETGVDKSAEEPKEMPCATRNAVVIYEWSWAVPVSEADLVMVGRATESDD